MKNDWQMLMNLPPEKRKQMEETLRILNGDPDAPEPEKEPDWLEGSSINEIRFANALLKDHPMKCIHDQLYDGSGRLPDEALKKEIMDRISPHITRGVPRRVADLLQTVKLACYSPELPVQEDRVSFRNGTLFLDGGFEEEHGICLNRLPVDFELNAPWPKRWVSFLNELLYEEDIPALQEFMGYLLIPSNRGQKMMILVGSGGEGKSRIGHVLQAVLGDNMNMSSVQKLATDRFCRADQEGRLLMLDDDMNMEALRDTNLLKAIITMEDRIDLERKGQQSTQGRLYCRIMAFSNSPLSALYDRSDGFYRRQMVLRVRPRDKDRRDDPFLGDDLIKETPGIILWMLEGLYRLRQHKYVFTVSERARQTLEENRRENNNMLEFYGSEGYIRLEKGGYARTRQLYDAYLKWCEDNLEKPFSERSFTRQLGLDAERLGIEYERVYAEAGRRVRGYRGICSQVSTMPYGVSRQLHL